MLPNLDYQYDVFVSYSRADLVGTNGKENAVSHILSLLDSKGISFWIDMNGIYSGQVFTETITNAIQRSRLFIFLSSRHSNTSEWTAREIFEAVDEGKTIIPVCLDNWQYSSSFRMILRPLDRIDYYKGDQDEQLVKSIRNVLDNQPPSRTIFYPDKNDYMKGMEYMEPLALAIRDMIPVFVTYRSYYAKSDSSFIVHPYFLKEYNHRWYLFGKRGKKELVCHLALDRILSIEYKRGEEYLEEGEFDRDGWFSDVIGVTKNKGDKAEIIRFMVSPQMTPYIESKPFHRSQRLVERLSDGSGIFEINVIVNFELLRILLSYANTLKVLEPDSLIQQLRKIYQNALDLYV